MNANTDSPHAGTRAAAVSEGGLAVLPRSVVLGLMAIGAIGLGIAAQLVGRSYSPAIVFPLVVGLCVGWMVISGVRRAGSLGRGALVALVLLCSLTCVLTQHLVSYLAYRKAQFLALERQPLGVGLAENQPGIASGWVDFTRASARSGREWIGGLWTEGGAWFTWLADLLLTVAGALGLVWVWPRKRMQAGN